MWQVTIVWPENVVRLSLQLWRVPSSVLYTVVVTLFLWWRWERGSPGVQGVITSGLTSSSSGWPNPGSDSWLLSGGDLHNNQTTTFRQHKDKFRQTFICSENIHTSFFCSLLPPTAALTPHGEEDPCRDSNTGWAGTLTTICRPPQLLV